MESRAKGLAAALLIAAVALLTVFGSDSFGGRVEASPGGMAVMSIDMDPTGNTSTSVGTLEQCARINKNGVKDADEDVVDGLIIDVTASGIPAFNDNGTPSNTADDSGGIVGYQYTLNYPPAQFTVGGQEASTPSVNILAANAGSNVFNGSDSVPDDNSTTTWDSYAIDTADPAVSPPESGNGVLDRLTIYADASATAGQYVISLSNNVHIDASGAAFFPTSTNVSNIAVGINSLPTCGTLISSLGYYHPVTPARILDTRSGPGPIGAVGPGGEITVDVTGVGTVPANPWDVSSVVVNVTVTGGTANSFLTVYPSGVTRPLASNLNFVAGQTVPNLVTVKVGADGNVKVFNAAGQTHVIFDVVGWYGLPSGGSLFNALPPARILDTRSSPQGSPPGKLNAGSTMSVQATGVGGVPPLAFGVTAVVVNATVTETTVPSYLTVYPTDVTRPNASNLNFVGGQTVPNLVAVKVGASDGRVNVYNAAGSTHVIFDVVGWYGGASGDVFNPVTPARVLDTRTSPQGTPPGAVGNNSQITVDVTGVGSLPTAGVSAVVVNTTVTSPTAPSYLTVFPSDVSPPTASNLNFVAGQTVPNLVIVKTGADGNVKVYNAAGQVHVIFDAVGFFGPVP